MAHPMDNTDLSAGLDRELHSASSAALWRIPVQGWLVIVAASIVMLTIFYDGLRYMIQSWGGKDEYSHAYLIPLISLFLIWQKSDRLRLIKFKNSWIGVAIVAAGLLVYLLGELSTLYIIVQYSFLIVLSGFGLSFIGMLGIKQIWVPLLFLLFMIPLPAFLYNNLSLQLQLISSHLGVEFIRYCDISVFLEGNVIDLGTYKLQVAEACNGLRYLFPFMSLAFLSAYLYQSAFWKRAMIFVSSVPISILMNSFRIGVIGVLVEYWGIEAAKGFVHDFEGWAVFMMCLAILVLEMWLLTRIGKDRKPLSQVFTLDFPEPSPDQVRIQKQPITKTAWTALSVLAVFGVVFLVVEKPVESAPARIKFDEFPLQVNDWKGRTQILKEEYAEVLQLDDYLLADFNKANGHTINFYAAYYASQSKGHSIHSPRSCLPGAGWIVSDLSSKHLGAGSKQTINAARAMIRKGDHKQLVYYWTQQRGRIINNEFLVKWYLFWDALTRQRSDGALVRLTTPLGATEALEQADQRLTRFAKTIIPLLPDYIPD